MKKIGKYQVLGLLGKGGMGRVYKAALPIVDKIVAVKSLSPHEHLRHLLGDKEITSIFVREATTLAQLRHPHIASITDFDTDQQGRPFFVMEYHCMNLGILIGEHYDALRPTRILPPHRAIRYIRQILSGLERLHYAGIIHRDIKPYNILISEDDQAKIIDFGLSRLRGETRPLPENLKIGTPYYAPPEQEINPDHADHRADLYSVGILAWRLLTGTLPPESGPMPKPSDIAPILGTGWDDVLIRSVQNDPDKRFQDCRSFRDEMDRAYADWRESMENFCRLPDAETQPVELRGSFKPNQPLRKIPQKIDRRRAITEFNLDDLWRPQLAVESEFKALTPETVFDRVNGLIWEQSGSEYPLSHTEAFEHAQNLRNHGFAGFTAWRLPTVNELMTLIRPANAMGDYCQPALFDPAKTRFWSCDKKSYTSGWFVDTESGFVADQDLSCRFYARAVSDHSISKMPV